MENFFHMEVRVLNIITLFINAPIFYDKFYILDASLYAHHVFKAFDANRNGSISFRVSLKKTSIEE